MPPQFETANFRPPLGLRNAHVQTILSGSSLRQWRLRGIVAALEQASDEVILDGGDGVRLHGCHTPAHGNPRGLITLIHGWHGHAGSSYLISSAHHLWQAGFGVLRLHLRDHGPSHHLNRDLFHSVRIAEVVNAIGDIRRRFSYPRYCLGGFSLGGNFALRVALRNTTHSLGLDRVVAVCPVLDPASAMDALSASPIYHRYFMQKWRQALLRKLEHFPEYDYAAALGRMRTMREMNAFFVPAYTGFGDTHSYLAAYAITGSTLATLEIPCHIIAADDDPVIPARDLAALAPSDALTIERSRWGGHCAFLDSYALDSWIDGRLESVFA